MANLIFLIPYFLLKLTYFFVDSASNNLENKIIKIMVPSKPQEPTFNTLKFTVLTLHIFRCKEMHIRWFKQKSLSGKDLVVSIHDSLVSRARYIL